MSRSERRRAGAAAALGLLLAGAGACELDRTSIPPQKPQLALHGVLSATAPSQAVLLERTRAGLVDLLNGGFEGADPLVTGDGIPESGAAMTLVAPDGATFIAVEDKNSRIDGKGEGVYRFAIAGSALVRGGTYRLTVNTQSGETLTAETSVPDGAAVSAPGLLVIDRNVDTLGIAWAASPTARSYYVRVESPFGPRTFFTESTHVRLPGLLRNVDVPALPHVFFPGFQQAVTVSAVDSNFYDWYRSHSDALSGEGLVNRVHGGLGVFGSLVRLRFDSVSVVAPRSGPIEGHYTLTGTPAELQSSRYVSFDVYVESPAARPGQSSALSGRYVPADRIDYVGCKTCGLLGSVQGGDVELALLKDWNAADTVEVLDGRIAGDTLIGTFRLGGGPYRFLRSP